MTAPFILRPHVSLAPTPDGTVLLDQRTGRYWQLNATAALVLRELLAGAGARQAADRLAAAHPQAADRAERDVAALLELLHEAELTAPPHPRGRR